MEQTFPEARNPVYPRFGIKEESIYEERYEPRTMAKQCSGRVVRADGVTRGAVLLASNGHRLHRVTSSINAVSLNSIVALLWRSCAHRVYTRFRWRPSHYLGCGPGSCHLARIQSALLSDPTKWYRCRAYPPLRKPGQF
jgi:hypothetical protein